MSPASFAADICAGYSAANTTLIPITTLRHQLPQTHFLQLLIPGTMPVTRDQPREKIGGGDTRGTTGGEEFA